MWITATMFLDCIRVNSVSLLVELGHVAAVSVVVKARQGLRFTK